MARIFRIKNGFLRWLAGLFVAMGAGIVYVAKATLSILCVFTILTLMGLGVKYLSGAMGFPPSDWLSPILKSAIGDPHLMQMFWLGIASLMMIILAICFVIVPFAIIVMGCKKAKEYGDKFFDSIDDKKKPKESS